MKDRITSSNEVQADAISVKNLDKGEFLIKSSLLTDTAYRLHFGSNEAMPHCDCPDWAQTLLPCKHFVAMMREFKEWTWAKFPEEYKSSPYLTLFVELPEMNTYIKSVQQQPNGVDCGVFAIAFATALAFGNDPTRKRFNVKKMHRHLRDCLKVKRDEPIPGNSW